MAPEKRHFFQEILHNQTKLKLLENCYQVIYNKLEKKLAGLSILEKKITQD